MLRLRAPLVFRLEPNCLGYVNLLLSHHFPLIRLEISSCCVSVV